MGNEADPPLYEPFAVQEIHLDGFFSDAHVDGETFRSTAFSMQSAAGEVSAQPVAVVRLIMPIRAARHYIEQATAVLLGEEAKMRSSGRRRRSV
jgi:hypothetical protein